MAPTAIRDGSIAERYGRLLSCSARCAGFSFEAFLAEASGEARFFWADPGGGFSFAGAGTAVELMAWGPERFDRIANSASELFNGAFVDGAGTPLSGPRLMGGFAFRSDFTPDNTWSIYSPAYFVLPHYQFVKSGDAMWLTINAQIPPDESPTRLLPDLRAALQEKIAQLTAREWAPLEGKQSALLGINYPMPYRAWQRMIKAATDCIRTGVLRKIVLARAAELRFKAPVNLLPILRHLAAHYANCCRFLFEPRPRYAFYGASPELLASVRGRQLDTMALAGSAARGQTEAADHRLGAELLASAKEREEHAIVVDKMRDRLAPVMDSLEIGNSDLLKLSNIQHINTPIRGSLKHRSGILPLVEALHPTPALGGDPRPEALRLIRELEPIPRGWYGAPVGWIDSQLDGEFAVAIRSAVAQEARAWVYAGAGIVADSEPRSEWAETELKFRPMLDAHGVI